MSHEDYTKEKKGCKKKKGVQFTFFFSHLISGDKRRLARRCAKASVVFFFLFFLPSLWDVAWVVDVSEGRNDVM